MSGSSNSGSKYKSSPGPSTTMSLCSKIFSTISITSVSVLPPIATHISTVVIVSLTIVFTTLYNTFIFTSSKSGPIARLISRPPTSTIIFVIDPEKSHPPEYSANPVATPDSDNISVPLNTFVLPLRPVTCM